MKNIKKPLSLTLVILLIVGMLVVPAAAATIDGVFYNGQYHEPEPTVSLSGQTLNEGIHYEVSYLNNKEVGTATIAITGIGSFASMRETLYFEIHPRPITVTVQNQTYYGDSPTYSYQYKITSGTVVAGESLGAPVYQKTASSLLSDGKLSETLSVSFPDAKNYNVTVVTGEVTTYPSNSVASGITIQPVGTLTYDGTDQTPVVVVKNGNGQTLTNGVDYTLSFSNSRNAGTGTVTATGRGSYAGQSDTQSITIAKRDVHVVIDSVTVKQGEAYETTWTASKDICGTDVLTTPTFDIPNSSQAPGYYPIKATFPSMANYNILVTNGILTITDTDGNKPTGNDQNQGTGTPTAAQEGFYLLTAKAGVGGSISPSGTIEVKQGSSINFAISVDAGYRLKAVYVNGTEVDLVNGYSFSNVTENQLVEAEFEKIDEPEKKPEDGQIGSGEGTAAGTNPFTDVGTGDWYYQFVIYTKQHGIINGTSETTFSPNVATTRGMIVTILYRMENTPIILGGANTFEDVAAGTYYADAITWAQINSIVTGYSETQFGPNDNITREQLATILHRFAAYKGLNTSKAGSLHAFADSSEVSEYALDGLKWCVAEGLINGRTAITLVPGGIATRAEVATIITKYLQGVAA